MIWLVMAGAVASFVIALSLSKKEEPEEIKFPKPTGENTFQQRWGSNARQLAAGATALAGLGLSLGLNSPYYQKVTVDRSHLSLIQSELGKVVVGNPTATDLGNIKNQYFIQEYGDGTAQVVYVKELPDGTYSVRTVTMNPAGLAIAADPKKAIPFYRYDKNTGQATVNPDAEEQLDNLAKATTSASELNSPVSQVVAIRTAGAAGHEVRTETN